jgi:omega-6 fatty acid desaturase (delta-12 desaturase)
MAPRLNMLTKSTPRNSSPVSPVDWRKLVSKYKRPSNQKAVIQVINTLGAYLVSWVMMYFALQISWWLVVPFLLLAGSLLVRVFIIFHDCCHGSFLESRRANHVLGFLCGILTFTPYNHWRWEHALHHASSGDLDRRGIGDIWTMTLAEYVGSCKRTRFLYRISRNPFVMFAIAPVFLLFVYQRFSARNAKARERGSVWLMNLAIFFIYAAAAWIFGSKEFLIILTTVAMIAGGVGVWLFYVQHQFEDVIWERKKGWEFAAAAMQGSSYYRLPRILQWISGNIGFHHIHHLCPQIPNYNLQACHESDAFFSSVPPVTLRESWKTTRLKLWDEKNRRLVGFSAVGRATGWPVQR